MEYPEASRFIHNFFVFKFSTFHQTQTNIVLTTLNIDLAEALLNFILSRTYFAQVYNIMNYKRNLDIKSTEKKFIKEFIKSLFESNDYRDQEIQQIFKLHSIKNAFLQELIYNHLKSILMIECRRNRIFDEKLRSLLKVVKVIKMI